MRQKIVIEFDAEVSAGICAGIELVENIRGQEGTSILSAKLTDDTGTVHELNPGPVAPAGTESGEGAAPVGTESGEGAAPVSSEPVSTPGAEGNAAAPYQEPATAS